jgi:hypothetical protein
MNGRTGRQGFPQARARSRAGEPGSVATTDRITRAEIIARAQTWASAPRPYSQEDCGLCRRRSAPMDLPATTEPGQFGASSPGGFVPSSIEPPGPPGDPLAQPVADTQPTPVEVAVIAEPGAVRREEVDQPPNRS